MNKYAVILLALVFIFLLSGCLQKAHEPGNSTARGQEELRLSTTTSTCDTGLLDELNKEFEEKYSVTILTLCQGTGKAIATGELGAADVVMVHAPASELRAIANGSFVDRTFMMHNYFVIVGPAHDPAGVIDAHNASDAFRRIALARSPFISRGDDSGTHQKEKIIWNAANITPAGTWYQSVGKGMGETLITADIKEGYTLSDRGTYLAMRGRMRLAILFEKDREYLMNPYHVMAVNPEKFPDAKYSLATQYIGFVTSPQGRDIIRNYGKDRYGEALFEPAEMNDHQQ